MLQRNINNTILEAKLNSLNIILLDPVNNSV